MALELLGGGAVAGVTIACVFVAGVLFTVIVNVGSRCFGDRKRRRSSACGKLLFDNDGHKPRGCGQVRLLCLVVLGPPVAFEIFALAVGLVLGLAPQTVGMMIAVTVGGTLGFSCCCSTLTLWLIWNGLDWEKEVECQQC
ncbi:hypothetical protein Pelo_6945 [Pelomyxa schiedti]|nr:hypothetical protein Pelo_6945 [Pelomyxa schiedti]